MCVLCQATRKSKSISSLVMRGFATRGSSSSSVTQAKEPMDVQKVLSRMYGALPQSDTTHTNPTKVDGYVLHPSTLNQNMLKAQYAVRGELYNKAQELAAEGREIIYTNGTQVVVVQLYYANGCCRVISCLNGYGCTGMVARSIFACAYLLFELQYHVISGDFGKAWICMRCICLMER